MENLYDVIVVGGGPAGLTAALYLARAKYRVLVLEKLQFGGQISITNEVVNYPGIERTSGQALTDTMQKQAAAFGAEFMLAEATVFDLSGDIKTVHTNRGDYRCFGVLLATGAHPRTVGFKGEEELKGRGVAYCATCDGEFFTGKDIYVVGGGYAAAEESVFLTKFARHVTILIRKNDFSCAASVADQAKNHEKITVLTNTVLEEVAGKNGLHYARYKNTATGEVTEVKSPAGETFGVFVLAGYAPDTEMLKGTVELNEQSYIVTDAAQKTSVDGVYAAGDVCIKPLRQVVTATSDGALAATELEKYVAAMQRKTGLRANVPASKQSETAVTVDTQEADGSGELFTAEMRQQLDTVFDRMESPLLLKLYLDDRTVSQELEQFITALAELSDKLTASVAERSASSDNAPCVTVCRADGTEMGLAFHGVPSGHEFTSFVLGLYNAAGPGQAIDSDTKRQIASITSTVNMKLLVTLSCTMCPDLVVAAQHIAAENPHITAHVYDIRHFENLKERYNVMSVPCLVINDDKISFGKKNMEQILQLIL
ncbi:FAD-dependent oxidoreductase [Intestinimonas timonensis]|uniref:FAD-dependent oxidoreductase n=1 Tax=Intestinimonas timonensis TaxID=1689270 RepID=UPI0010317C1C|nr:FAD-dependent oxidoreductase [Intestinimonas timonensis]